MAKSSSYGLALACFAIAAAVAGATQYTVGGAGSNGWTVPAAGAQPLNTWAERTRFQVGDTLLFVYPKDQDSVLQVDPADYNACNTASYVKKFDDGATVVALDRAGAFFFISGVEANCRANEKLIVMVLAARSNGTGTSTAPPPASPASSPPPASSTTPPPSSSPAPPKAPPTAASPPAPAPPAGGSASSPPPASAPTKTPTTPPAASSPPLASANPPPPPAPAGAAPQAPPPPAPSASSPAPSAHGSTGNSTGTPPSRPSGAYKDKNGAALTVATGLASSFGACILGYAMLAL